jgi:subtilisin family serine protease
MKKILFITVFLGGIAFFSCQKNEIPDVDPHDQDLITSSAQIIEGKYIVVYEDEGLLKSASAGGKVAPEAVMKTTLDLFTNLKLPLREPEFIYNSALRGIAVEMTGKEALEISKAPGVKGVYPDMMVTFNLPVVEGRPSSPSTVQYLPWGVTRIGGTANGTGKTAWIIDTGIDFTHPDLTVDASRGKSFVPKVDSPDDDNGHGTHVAGIVAALDNSFGVVGVAAGATVVPVKVLNRQGSGAYSWIIAGVNFVAGMAERGDAANISLGGPVYQPMDIAVYNLGKAGISVSLAAGNEAMDANNLSPARINGNNIFTISAMSSGDIWAYYSNFGNPPVDYCAPGTYVISTYKGGRYAAMSGTSMAAPHVCGLLLSGKIITDGYVSDDPDGDPDPIAHR